MNSARALQDMKQFHRQSRLVGRPLPGRSAFRVQALPPPQPILSSQDLLGSKDLTNGYTAARRRFPAGDFGGLDGARLGMPADAATDDPLASTAASVWVEAECLALEASLEDLVQSLGNDHFGPDMGQHMQHSIY